jgi:hypothetical protein
MLMTSQSANKRPELLTIICILSFIGLGLGIFNGFTGLVFSSVSDSIIPLIEDASEQVSLEMTDVPESTEKFVQEMFDIIIQALDDIAILSLLILLTQGLALSGVIMMWNLKKTGFYIYVAGKVIYLLIPVSVLGFNVITAMVISSNSFFVAIFIVLYAIHFKYLK